MDTGWGDRVPGFGMPVMDPDALSGFGRLSTPVVARGAVVLSLPHAASSTQAKSIQWGKRRCMVNPI
jgi:hypothetical protein